MDMADVIIIFASGHSELLDDESLAELFAATNVERLIEGAIACTVPYCMTHHIERHPSVAYVRRVQAYVGCLGS
jgi:hypothetical protein